MKKAILILGLVLLTVCPVSAQKKTSQYPEATSLGTNDLVLISYWNGSSWTTNKFLRSTNLFAQINALGIWTNSAGTIQASSAVTDGASAVGFAMNSSNFLSTYGSFLAAIQNHGTNSVRIGDGSLILGPNTLNWADPTTMLSSFLFEDDGESNPRQLYFGNIGTGDVENSVNIGTSLNNGGSANLIFYVQGKRCVLFRPSSNLTSPAYQLDTAETHTSGNIFEIANNTTNRFGVDILGGVTTGLPTGATNAQPFKIGSEANAVGLVLVATNYIQIEVNGVAYKLGLVQ